MSRGKILKAVFAIHHRDKLRQSFEMSARSPPHALARSGCWARLLPAARGPTRGPASESAKFGDADVDELELLRAAREDQLESRPREDCPLIGLDEFSSRTARGQHEFPVFTEFESKIPTGRTTQNRFDDRFARLEGGKEVSKLLSRHWPSVICAGGAVTRCLTGHQWDSAGEADIDLFLVGPFANEDTIIKDLIDELCRGSSAMVQVSNRTITIRKRSQLGFKVQLIIKRFHGMSHCLKSFDLGSCQAAYDGRDVYLTEMGLYCVKNQINLVDPGNRPAVYFRRLIKYLARGFDLGLVGMSNKWDRRMTFPGGLELIVRKELNEFTRFGRAAIEAGEESTECHFSGGGDPWPGVQLATLNPIQLTRVSIAAIINDEPISYYYTGNKRVALDYATGKDLKTRQFVSEADFTKAILTSLEYINSVTTEGYDTLIKLLRDLGVPASEALALAVKIRRTLDAYRGRKVSVDFGPLLLKHTHSLHAKYLAREDDAINVVKQFRSPAGASPMVVLDPAAPAEAEWYGARRATAPVARRREPRAARAICLECPLCIEEISPTNLVVTRCGHAFHLRRVGPGDCAGFVEYLRQFSKCPVCRESLAGSPPAYNQGEVVVYAE